MHLSELAVVRPVDGDESGDNREPLGAVQLVARAAAVEALGPAGAGVESATVQGRTGR